LLMMSSLMDKQPDGQIDVFPFTPAHQTSDSTARAKLGNGGRQRYGTTEVARASA
jgi:hypothetical protein